MNTFDSRMVKVGGYTARVKRVMLAALAIGMVLAACVSHHGPEKPDAKTAGPLPSRLMQAHPSTFIVEPPDGAFYPADLAAPIFRWQGDAKGLWRVGVKAPGNPPPLVFTVRENPWVPNREAWSRIQNLSLGRELTMTVTDLAGQAPAAGGVVHFTVSTDRFDARVVYQEIPVPFRFAEKHVREFRWCRYEPGSYSQPVTVLTDLPYCANCHIFSRDGATFGLDIDYRGDKGGFVLVDVAEKMALKQTDVISWNDYLRGQGQVSRGLFAKISPTGDYVMATAKDRPFMVRIDDPAYSQFFVPLTGQLVTYSPQQKRFQPLSGADNPDVVQTSPDWSPDGQTIVFARARAPRALWQALGNQKLLDALPGEDIHDLNRKYAMRFDLWYVPFADGAGGIARPLTGAYNNGHSNYFARYSPDGRWIVFCRSDNGLVSQPGSRLVILPARGGQPREMNCNRPQLNSYHSFTPNGRWLVFSSKPDDSPLTRVFLTHLNPDGSDSPAVYLHRIGTPGLAAILPEAVGLAETDFNQACLVDP